MSFVSTLQSSYCNPGNKTVGPRGTDINHRRCHYRGSTSLINVSGTLGLHSCFPSGTLHCCDHNLVEKLDECIVCSSELPWFHFPHPHPRQNTNIYTLWQISQYTVSQCLFKINMINVCECLCVYMCVCELCVN